LYKLSNNTDQTFFTFNNVKHIIHYG